MTSEVPYVWVCLWRHLPDAVAAQDFPTSSLICTILWIPLEIPNTDAGHISIDFLVAGA